MSTYYSDHFSSDGAAVTTLDDQKRASAGISHGRIRYKAARFSGAAPQTTDTIRMMQFKSSDRLIEMFISSDGTPSAGAVNIGLYKSSLRHDGAVIDADLFGAAIDQITAAAREDALTEAALGDLDRGKTLWEQATVGAASYTADPIEDWDVVIVPSTNFTGNGIILLEAYYTSGD
jgi:hypothetical protein